MRVLSLVVCSLCIVASSVCASGAPPFEEFSADIVTRDQNGVTSGKTYVARDKVRMELPGAVVITRLDKDASWVFIPEQKIYLEQPIDRKFISSTTQKMANETDRELLGVETVGGREAKKYRVSFMNGTGPVEVLQWIAEGTAIPVKTAAADGSWSVEYRNIKTGPVDEALFEIPKGYEPLPLPVPPPGIPDDMGMADG